MSWESGLEEFIFGRIDKCGFGSRSKRFPKDKDTTPGPGSYNPKPVKPKVPGGRFSKEKRFYDYYKRAQVLGNSEAFSSSKWKKVILKDGRTKVVLGGLENDVKAHQEKVLRAVSESVALAADLIETQKSLLEAIQTELRLLQFNPELETDEFVSLEIAKITELSTIMKKLEKSLGTPHGDLIAKNTSALKDLEGRYTERSDIVSVYVDDNKEDLDTIVQGIESKKQELQLKKFVVSERRDELSYEDFKAHIKGRHFQTKVIEDVIKPILADHYSDLNISNVSVLSLSDNDYYKCTDQDGLSYVLRVTRLDKECQLQQELGEDPLKTPYEFEHQLLQHLHDNEVDVTYTLPQKNEQYYSHETFLDGEARTIALQNFIEGELGNMSTKSFLGLAKTLSQWHTHSQSFDYRPENWVYQGTAMVKTTKHSLEELKSKDYGHVLNEKDYVFMHNCIESIENGLAEYESKIKGNREKFGPVHGDCNHLNHMYQESNDKTVIFDTDLAKIGPYIYDLAVVKWASDLAPPHMATRCKFEPFLKTYKEVNSMLDDRDFDMLDHYVLVRQFKMIQQDIKMLNKNPKFEIQGRVQQLRELCNKMALFDHLKAGPSSHSE